MPPDFDESEWKTRKTRIDTRLRDRGWAIVPFDETKPLSVYTRHAVEEFPTDHGPADYALFVQGRPLGIIEAKKLSIGPQNVLTQAERYARGFTGSPFHFGAFRVPFLYSTNGTITWHHDIRHVLSISRKIADFHTPKALEEMLARDFDASCQALEQLPNQHASLRPYQREANAGTEKAIRDRKRYMLLAMATGTGKTFTTVNQVYRLMKSTGVDIPALEFIVFLRPVQSRILWAQMLGRGTCEARQLFAAYLPTATWAGSRANCGTN